MSRHRREHQEPDRSAEPAPHTETLLVRDLDQLKALSDPLRVRILQEFTEDALTVKEVAKRLGAKQSRLYHHVALLEAAGLLKVVATRPVRGTVEKHYQPAASRFEVDGAMFSAGPSPDLDPDHFEMVSRLLAQARAELLDSSREVSQLEANAPRPFLARMVFNATSEEATALIERFQALLGECCGEDSALGKESESHDYALTLAMCALQPKDPDPRT